MLISEQKPQAKWKFLRLKAQSLRLSQQAWKWRERMMDTPSELLRLLTLKRSCLVGNMVEQYFTDSCRWFPKEVLASNWTGKDVIMYIQWGKKMSACENNSCYLSFIEYINSGSAPAYNCVIKPKLINLTLDCKNRLKWNETFPLLTSFVLPLFSPFPVEKWTTGCLLATRPPVTY